MRFLKRILTTIVCALLSKFAQAQISQPDTIFMYSKDDMLYLDETNLVMPDTIYAKNDNGRFEEQALTIENKDGSKTFDILSMCRNRSTPHEIKLIRIGSQLYRIGTRVIVKIDERTMKAFVKSFDYPRHCDHMSHASHVSHSSHYSSIDSTEFHYSHYSSSF